MGQWHLNFIHRIVRRGIMFRYHSKWEMLRVAVDVSM